MSDVHRYASRLTWAGSTGDGYESYSREHRVTCPPARDELPLSSDPHFRGDAELLNPEQLVVAAASSCQLLSFLARAARARIEVLEYTDASEGTMDGEVQPMWIQRIVLRPRIVVGPGTDEERVLKLVDSAHHGCFVANSLRTEVVVEPSIEVRS